ncbi:NCS1 family transporter [Bacillus sp. DTU_2020_1000418_1_SI_GHA_SEK_038]|uniref:NCS1 family transporter n=1 Tax=Bacillus sp. DTU_2020_1000418_1_SI_GHA_SEK_038 TaxID=3077585 RepID=UPI0028EA1B81|nr:NCS1 family transporter [Bacillus sp. DTU_2020_1000418_1_SI_GHA_SEK_038]WNS76231.1 NCS1 family transporter [Bacillus sp. DTU_2020_1000418_1_SI_GHA_SEK_038]
MGQNSTEIAKGSRRESLNPVSSENRIFGLTTYITLWISSMVVIQIFMVGQSFLPPAGKLNIFQAGVVTVISALFIGLLFVINSRPGIKYGIPFIVQARSSFGYNGARIASLIRVLPAVFWYGIGSWIGASAMEFVTQTIWGWGNIWVYFILFQVVQTFIAYFGMNTIKWFDSILSVVVLGFLIYITIQLINAGGLKIANTWNTSGSWGMPFFAAITASVGILITAAINNGDLSRYLENKPGYNAIGHFVGIVPMFIIILGIGVLSAAATGIWDPVQALVSVIPNPIVAVAMMIFIIVAQITTNLTINIKPPAIVLMETFNITWGLSVIIVGLLSIVTFPWLLISSSVFNTFISFYSAFLGPLLGILIADYYFIHKQKFNVESLYNKTIKYNWLGLGSLLIGGIIGVIFLPISWMVSMPISALLYWAGYQYLPNYKSKNASNGVDITY